MHKIIKEFIESNKNFIDIINENCQSDQPIEMVFLTILQQMNNNHLPTEIYKTIDEAIKKGHPDKELFSLFISHLIIFYSIRDLVAKSESVYRIACSFDVIKYQPQIQAYHYMSCSYYFHSIKDFAKRDEANLISISKMPKGSVRYKAFLISISQVFGVDGRLQELSKEDFDILDESSEKNFVSISSLLMNAMFTVNMKMIDKYYAIIVTKFKDDVRLKKEMLNYDIGILKGDFEVKNSSDQLFNIFLSYYKSLKIGNIEIAKNIYKNIDASHSAGRLDGIFGFINYHHAFVTGRYEMIENIIKNRENQSYHYMLDFFVVRYFLIKNNQEIARYYYARLFKNCEKYQAMGKLKFEMQFSFELSLGSLIELTQPLQSINSAEISKSLEMAFNSKVILSTGLDRIVGKSNAISEIKKKIKKFADIQRPILILGETGAGKEIVARAIHEESTHNEKPFLAINCGALTDTLLQSELFGYEAGAFTGAVNAHKGIFEAAEDGIVFMDEFGEMSHKLQVSLLRVLENNEVMRVGGTKVRDIKCRIIAATNANIEDLISKKLFREDLYHRLKQFVISIPPLRERKEDIPELINYFLNQPEGGQPQVFSKELTIKFQEYHWPGNIRELKNEIDRIKILCGYKPVIEVDDIEIEWLKNNKKSFPLKSASHIPIEKNEQMHQRIIYKKLTLADKRNQQIKELFLQYKQLTRGQIAEALEINLLTATKDLKRLCQEGAIVKKMPSKSPRSHFFEIL